MNFAEARECVEHGDTRTVVIVPNDVFESLKDALADRLQFEDMYFLQRGVRNLMINGKVVVPACAPPSKKCRRCGRST